MLLLWAIALVVREFITLESHAYIFKVDPVSYTHLTLPTILLV